MTCCNKNNNKNDCKHNADKANGCCHDIPTCPMHPEIKQDNPGKCPKCRGVDSIVIER